MKIYIVYWLKYDNFGINYRQNEYMVIATNEKEAEKIYRKYTKVHGNRKVYVENAYFKKSGILRINAFNDIITEIEIKNN